MSSIILAVTNVFGSVFDPEAGLTLTTTYAQGAIANPGTAARQSNVVFAADITFPSSFTGVTGNRTIFDMGATARGAGIGFVTNGSNLTTLTCTAGDGGNPPVAGDTAYVQIPVASLTAGESGTLVWDIRVNPGRVRVWWNGVLIGTGNTSDGTALESSEWAGGATGCYISGAFGTNVAPLLLGNPTANYTDTGGGTATGGLRYYQGQLVVA